VAPEDAALRSGGSVPLSSWSIGCIRLALRLKGGDVAGMTITEKIRAILNEDVGPIDFCHGGVPGGTSDGRFSEFELDCLDWGVMYGIAFAIARAEDPFEGMASVASRALEAARPVCAEFAGVPFHWEARRAG
jgi:hypothetical protein